MSSNKSDDGAKCPVDHEKMMKENPHLFAQMKEQHMKMQSQTNAEPKIETVSSNDGGECKRKPKTTTSDSAKSTSTEGCGCGNNQTKDEYTKARMASPSLEEPASKLLPGHDTAPGPEGLSTKAVSSHIPRSGKDLKEDEKWMYPSQQRFYNAMKKKGWNPSAEDVPFVHAIHNAVNERSWSEVMKYEKFHENVCKEPKLMKFRGRPRDFSPKARFLSLLGYKLPFDRHDWIIDRCGTEVRYIIDFYGGSNTNNLPMPSMYLDVRPAFQASNWKTIHQPFVDRARMFMNEMLGSVRQGMVFQPATTRTTTTTEKPINSSSLPSVSADTKTNQNK